MNNKEIVIVNSMVCKNRPFGSSKQVFLARLREQFANIPVYFTEHPAHATFIAQENSNADLIIVAGGDGTISEVLNGMDFQSQIIGVIPMGTGNSLARQTGIRSYKEAIEAIKFGKIILCDILECTMTIHEEKYKRYAVATTGFGYASNVADIGNIWFKGAGRFCYSIGSIFAFLYPDTMNAQVTIDDEFCLLKKVTNMIVNNTNYSGNFKIFNDAETDDGQLNILYSFNNKIQQLVQNIGLVSRRRWYLHTIFQKAKKVDIVFEKPTKFMLDGEIFDFVSDVSIRVLPKHLKLVA